jgi:excisionase family DNA binding protein
MEPLWNVSKLASLLGISEHTVRSYASRGILPVTKVGARCLFSPAAIERWLAARSRPPAGQRKPQAQPSQSKGLDFESAAALVVGALQSPEGLEVVQALIRAHRQLGPDRLGELTERVLVSLPPERRGEAKRRLAAAEEALSKVLLLMRAPAEAAAVKALRADGVPAPKAAAESGR